MVMKWKHCECCEQLHEVDLPKKPGLHRKRGKDGLIHEFIVHMPKRENWKRVRIHCIICREEHDLLEGPVTGKLYSQVCDRT